MIYRLTGLSTETLKYSRRSEVLSEPSEEVLKRGLLGPDTKEPRRIPGAIFQVVWQPLPNLLLTRRRTLPRRRLLRSSAIEITGAER